MILKYACRYSIEELVHFINSYGIKKENIVKIALTKDGKQYYVLYWERNEKAV